MSRVLRVEKKIYPPPSPLLARFSGALEIHRSRITPLADSQLLIRLIRSVSRAPSLGGDSGTTPPCYGAKRKVWQTRSINSQSRRGEVRRGAARVRRGRDVARRGRREERRGEKRRGEERRGEARRARGGAARLGVSRPRRSHRLAQLRPSSSPPLVLQTPLRLLHWVLSRSPSSYTFTITTTMPVATLVVHREPRAAVYSGCTPSREFVIYEKQARGPRGWTKVSASKPSSL